MHVPNVSAAPGSGKVPLHGATQELRASVDGMQAIRWSHARSQPLPELVLFGEFALAFGEVVAEPGSSTFPPHAEDPMTEGTRRAAAIRERRVIRRS